MSNMFRDFCCSDEPFTAPSSAALFAPKTSSCLTPRLTLSSQPVVLSRIILTSCHSSIHTLAGSQGSLPCVRDGRALTHTHPGNTPGFPFLALPERTEHTVFFPKLHVPVSFQQDSSPQHRSTKPFLLTASDTPGAAPNA